MHRPPGAGPCVVRPGFGAYVWHVCGEPEPWYSLEATTEDTVYVGASFDLAAPIVIALDTATGVERWRVISTA